MFQFPNSSIVRSTIACVFLFLSLSCVSQEKEIAFPTGWDFARVFVFESPTESDLVPGFMDFAWSGKVVGLAGGKVSVPADAFVGVEIKRVSGYEKFLDGLPTDGIQRLDLKKIKLTNQTIRQLERIKSLRQLNLTGCSVDAVDVEQIQGWPNLQHLQSNDAKESPELHRVLVSMASKSPKMQFFFESTALKLDEVRQFRGHEAPLCIKVVFDSDAVETMQALSEIPGLAGLTAQFGSEAPPKEFHHSFSTLKRLIWISWNGGKLDLDLLNSLSKTTSVKNLLVQGGFEVSDEFVENLPQWKTVASVSFNRPLSEYQQKILPDILLKMPGVSRLPKVSNVTSEQIDFLMQRESINDLKIEGLGEGATAAQVARVIEKHDDLQFLTLSGVPWTKELAKAICKRDRLAQLSLKVDDFDGRFLDSADQLRRLESMTLEVNGNAIDLAALGEFPNLGSLQISLNAFDKSQWSFIADAKALRTLSVLSGYCDDEMVPWIKSNPSLHNFSTYQVAYFTDAGVKELSTCDHLESLIVGGLVSEDAVMLLRKLPKLDWLHVSSDLIDEEAKKRIEAEFSDLEFFSLREFSGAVTLGKDKIIRQVPDDGRDALDALEGKTLEEMMGDALTDELQGQMKGQVVLVEFWGTWCGPCLHFIPELQRLQKKYEARGFKVLAVHSKADADTANDYLKANPKPWPNLIDSDGTIEESFSVPSFPATYIFGTDGKLKVAVPMRHNLGPVLERFLDDPSG